MKNLTIITLNQPNITDFAMARNIELAKATTPWVLFLDSDETLSPELESEIASALRADEYSAYYIRRLDIFLGQQLFHGETAHAQFVRLARRDFGKWVRPVHETWDPTSTTRIGQLKHPIIHHAHPDISSFLAKINGYSDIEASYRKSQGIKSSLFKIWMYPLAKFKLNYFFRLGFLDGVPGIIMAMMMSFHSYLTWTKLYLLWHKK